MIKLCNLYLPSRLFVFILIDGTFFSTVLLATLHSDPRVTLHWSGWQDIVASGLACATCIGCMYLFGLYDLDLNCSGHDILLRSLRAMGCGVLLVVPMWWLIAPRSRRYEGMEIFLIIFMVSVCLYRLFVEWIRARVLPGERLLLVGSGPSIQLLVTALRRRHSLPLKLTGVVSESAELKMDASAFTTCGFLPDFERVSESSRPDRIAIGLCPHATSLPAERLLELRRRGVRVEAAIDLYEALTGRVPVELIDIEEMAFGKGLRQSPFGILMNRACGAVVATILILLLIPLLLVIALCITFESKGGVLYRQERVGLYGRPFHVLKFRSMGVDAESHSGPVWAKDGDPRVTKVGRVLRTLRLDELPQLWNVLRGEMCLVGPRPERPHFTAKLRECLPYYDVRHSIPPGITGWAQVCTGYGSTIEESKIKLEYDLFYLQNQCQLLDALILVKTIKVALFGRGAR